MVQIEGLGHILQEHPFFDDMDPAVLEIVVGCCSNVLFKSGSYLFRQGEAAEKFYLLRTGLVGLEFYVPGRQPISVETIEAGEIVGWSWLIPPFVWSSDARAIDTVRAVSVDGACLRRKMENDRALGYEMYKRFLPIVAKRMANNRLRILELAIEPGGEE
jgi:CRP-like cAMP-binding protein